MTSRKKVEFYGENGVKAQLYVCLYILTEMLSEARQINVEFVKIKISCYKKSISQILGWTSSLPPSGFATDKCTYYYVLSAWGL